MPKPEFNMEYLMDLADEMSKNNMVPNDRTDDIISWEDAYKIFSEIQMDSFKEFFSNPFLEDEKLDSIVEKLDLQEKEQERIKLFLAVMTLIAQASVIKKMVQRLVSEYHE